MVVAIHADKPSDLLSRTMVRMQQEQPRRGQRERRGQRNDAPGATRQHVGGNETPRRGHTYQNPFHSPSKSPRTRPAKPGSGREPIPKDEPLLNLLEPATITALLEDDSLALDPTPIPAHQIIDSLGAALAELPDALVEKVTFEDLRHTLLDPEAFGSLEIRSPWLMMKDPADFAPKLQRCYCRRESRVRIEHSRTPRGQWEQALGQRTYFQKWILDEEEWPDLPHEVLYRVIWEEYPHHRARFEETKLYGMLLESPAGDFLSDREREESYLIWCDRCGFAQEAQP